MELHIDLESLLSNWRHKTERKLTVFDGHALVLLSIVYYLPKLSQLISDAHCLFSVHHNLYSLALSWAVASYLGWPPKVRWAHHSTAQFKGSVHVHTHSACTYTLFSFYCLYVSVSCWREIREKVSASLKCSNKPPTPSPKLTSHTTPLFLPSHPLQSFQHSARLCCGLRPLIVSTT